FTTPPRAVFCPPRMSPLTSVSQVDAVEPVEVAVDSGAARGAEPVGAGSEDAESSGAETVGAGSGGTEFGGAEPWGAEPGGAESGGAEPGGVAPGGTASTHVASRGASSRRELLSPQELREWFARRWSRAAGAGGSPVASGPGGARTSGTRAVGTGGAGAATGVGPAGASGAAGARATGGVGAGVRATGASGAAGAGAAGCVDTGVGPAGGTAGSAGGTGAAGPAGVGAVGAGGAASTGASTGGTGTVPVGTGGPARPRPYFVPLLEQVLGLPPSLGPAPPLACPPPVQSQSQLQPVSPLPAPSPYAGPTGGLAERREPASRPTSPVRTARASRRALRPCPPAVLDTHQMTLRPSTAPLRVPLPSSPASSLPALADPASDSLRAVSPTVARLLSTVVTDPSFESTAASALVDELVDFAARCRLDYAASLVAESASVCPPSVGGECALRTDILEDRQEEIQCFAAALPHLAIEGPYSSQWQLAMDAEMASWKSTGTYVDKVPPPGANIVSGMYVDDLVFATADTAGLAHVKSELQKRHTCIDLGELRSYLGLQITQDRAQRTITLTQSHMVQQVLQRFDFTYSSPQATPLSTRHSLSALPSDESVEPSGPYPELVGCLMYLMTCTRPDLAYPLSILARYVAPGRHRPEHMAAAKRVLRYLCSTSGFGLVLGGRRPVVLTGHADASWADDQATQRSSQGYTFSLGSGSVSWRSTRSSSVLGSSCEAEIYAGAMAAQELRWLTYLLADLGEPPSSPPVLYVDNKAMLALCREHRLEHRTKHIALRYFLARELQQRGQLRLAYVASQANTADIFTKALPPGDHQHFCTMLACFALLDWSCDLLFSPTLPMGCRAALQLLALPALVRSPAAARASRLAAACESCPAAACESRPAALPSTRRPALQPAPSCPAACASHCPALKPARRPALQLASRAALPLGPHTALPCPTCAPLPCALRPAAARASRPAARASHPAAARASCPAAARAARPAAARSSRPPAPRVALYCSLRVVSCCPARHTLLQPAHRALQPARRTLLQPARRPLLQPARRALLQPSASHPTALPSVRLAALSTARPAALQPEAHPALPSPAELRRPGQAAPPSPSPLPSRPPATTATAARAFAAGGGGAAGSAGGAGGAGPATDRCPGGGGFDFMYTGQRRQRRQKETFSPQWLRDCVSQRGVLGCVEAAALGSGESAAAPSASEFAAPFGAHESADTLGASASTATAPASTEALHTFTLDSGASRCFFRDCTTVTPLAALVLVSLADPTGDPVVAGASTVLPCLAVPSGSLSGLHLPAFSKNLLSNAVRWLRQVGCLRLVKLKPLARAGYSLTRLSSGTTASVTPRYRVSTACTPVSLSLAFQGPCPLSRARLHRRAFPTSRGGSAPLSLLRVSSNHCSSVDSHMDVWGPAPVGGMDRERYFLLVVDDYTCNTTVFPLRRKADVNGVLIPWIRATHHQLRERFQRDLPILRLHSNKGASHWLDHGGCSYLHDPCAPHFLWPFAIRYAAHHLNLWPRVSEPETLPTLRWTGKVGDASGFRVWGALSLVHDA
ncbi:unnamed protein product, partial [Closterium sp. NIES-53]